MPNKVEFNELPTGVKLENVKPNMVIPFSEGANNPTLSYRKDHVQNYEYVRAYGFGHCNSSTSYCLGFRYNATTQSYDQFVSSNNYSSNGSKFGFNTATDIVRVTIYMEVVTTANITFEVVPYVAIAVASDTSDTFKILPETVTTTQSIPASSGIGKTLSASQTSIPVMIKRGTRLIIISGFTSPSSPASTYRYTSALKFSGGIALF